MLHMVLGRFQVISGSVPGWFWVGNIQLKLFTEKRLNFLSTSICLQHGLERLLSQFFHFFTMQILSIIYHKSSRAMVSQTNSQLKVPSLSVGKNMTSTLRWAIIFSNFQKLATWVLAAHISIFSLFHNANFV